MKKKSLIIIIFLVSILFCGNAKAQDNFADFDLFGAINQEIDKLNLTDFEDSFNDLPNEIADIWQDNNISDILTNYAKGKNILNIEDIGFSLLNVLKGALNSNILTIGALIALAILSGIVSQIKSSFGTQTSDAASFVLYLMSMTLVVYVFASTVIQTKDAIAKSVEIMQFSFPPLLTLLLSSGQTAQAGIVQPATVLLTTTISSLVQNVLLPMVLVLSVTVIIGNMSNSLQLNKLQKLIKTVLKWAIGAVGTIYVGALSLQGIGAKGFDSMTMRTTRFALDKFIPYVGGIVSGSADTILNISLLLKNALGITSVLLMLSTLLMPIIKIIGAQLSLRIVAALVEPLGNDGLAKSISEIGDVMGYLFAIVILQAIMFILTVGAVIGWAT